MLTLALAALAHDEEGELAVRPFVHDGELAGVWTTSGLAARDADDLFRRACAEVLPSLHDAWLRRDGAFLLATQDGLQRLGAGGCEASPEPLRSGPIAELEEAGGALYAVDLAAAGGPGLLRSDDDGDGWTPLPPLPDGPWLIDGLAADGRGRLVVAGLDALGTAVATWDGAAFVVERAPADPEGLFVAALGAAPDGVGVAVATSGFSPGARLWASSAGGWAPLVVLPEPPTGYGCLDGVCAAATLGGLYRWDPAVGTDSLELLEGPSSCLSVEDGAWWACAERLAPALVEVGDDPGAFEPALATGATLDRPCGLACPGSTPPTTTEPAGPPPPPEEPRGCATAPGSAAAAALALLGLRARRAAPRSGPATRSTPGPSPAPRTARRRPPPPRTPRARRRTRR